MSEFDFNTKMAKARVLMARQLGTPVIPKEWEYRETTPPLDDNTRAFLAMLEYDEVSYVDVVPSPRARPGWCFHNVRDHVAIHGGNIEHGKLVWGAPGTFYESEFHAVWVRPDGKRFDITPKVDGEREVMFASNPTRYPSHFDYLQRPGNDRFKIYSSVNKDGRAVREKIASLSASSLEYEKGRAVAKGMSLEAWIERRLPKDALETGLDAFLALANRHDAFLKVTEEGTTIRDRGRLQEYTRVARQLVDAKLKVWIMVEMTMMKGLAEEHRARLVAMAP